MPIDQEILRLQIPMGNFSCAVGELHTEAELIGEVNGLTLTQRPISQPVAQTCCRSSVNIFHEKVGLTLNHFNKIGPHNIRVWLQVQPKGRFCFKLLNTQMLIRELRLIGLERILTIGFQVGHAKNDTEAPFSHLKDFVAIEQFLPQEGKSSAI